MYRGGEGGGRRGGRQTYPLISKSPATMPADKFLYSEVYVLHMTRDPRQITELLVTITTLKTEKKETCLRVFVVDIP